MKPRDPTLEYLACSLLLERLEYRSAPYPYFIWKKGQCSGQRAGSLGKHGYRIIKLGAGTRGKTISICEHRLMWFYHHRDIPHDQVDHINGVRDDNRIENLRVVTPRGNSRNTKRHRNGHLWGTTKHFSGWRAGLTSKGKNIYIGWFKSQIDAHNAAVAYAKKHGFSSF